jgi:hypothetical protein
MASTEGAYSSYAWEVAETEEPLQFHPHNRPPTAPPDSDRQSPPTQPYPNSASPQPRSSVDSSSQPSTSRWRDSGAVEPRETSSTIPSDAATLVETAFDENLLRALCDIDVSKRSLPFWKLMDHIALSVVCRCFSIESNKAWSRAG